jgi:eukaryotic-like serine/threonine-protein kinase
MASQQELIEQIFEAALDLEPAQRSAFLASACRETPELRPAVEELLLQNDRVGSFLERPLLSFRGNGFASSSSGPGSTRLAEGGGPPAKVDPFTGRFKVGEILGDRFVVVRFIARGGMGEVYEVEDNFLQGTRVALKMILPQIATSPGMERRFEHEVLLARKIVHANLCPIYEIFHCEKPAPPFLFLTMKLLSGETLAARLVSRDLLPQADAAAICNQLIAGVAAIHAAGVIHRDIKPNNIMLDRHDSDIHVWITDFGLARLHESEATLTSLHTVAGTPAYMAPELLKGQPPSQASDIFALGVVMHEMFTGARPSIADAGRTPVVGASLNASKVPPDYARLTTEFLAEDPNRRCLAFKQAQSKLDSKSESGLAGFDSAGFWTRRRFAGASIAALGVAAAGVTWRRHELRLPAGAPSSLAVLPLKNRTGDVNLDYLASGISEALTNDLSRVMGLHVTAATVSRRYGGETADPRVAGRDLHVQSIVEGALASSAAAFLVPIELIDVKTGNQMWGHTYKGSMSGITDLQHEISTDVAYRLKVSLDPTTKARLSRQYSTSASAYTDYLRGRFHLNQRVPEALQMAIADFQRALDHDSGYAPAYAGLADCYSLIAYYGLQNPIPLLEEAIESSQRALEIDSTLGEAYTSRAFARTLLRFDWQGAEEDYKRATELNPTYVIAHTWYGLLLLMPLNRQAEASAQLAYSVASDPGSPVTNISMASLKYLQGSFDESIRLSEPRTHSLPAFEPAYQILALGYLGKNMNEEVIRLLDVKNLPEAITRQRAAPLGIAYARLGRRDRALRQLGIATTSIEGGEFLACETAKLYTALGNHGKALDMLELAYKRRESNIVFLKVDPLIAPLRSEPRFAGLAGLMHLQ